MATLTKKSGQSRTHHYKGRSIGERGQESRDVARIVRLAQDAANLAAAPLARAGHYLTPEDRQDATQSVLAAVWAAKETLTVAAMADPDRTLTDSDGRNVRPRPSVDLLALASSALRGEVSARERVMREAGGLSEQSGKSRQDGTKRSGEAQLVNPAADPCPPEVSGALDAAGIWPGDPLRLAATEATVSLPITPADWSLTLTTGAGKTQGALAKARQRGEARLALGALDTGVAGFGRELRERIMPTRAEDEEREHAHLVSTLTDGTTQTPDAAPLIDSAWRDRQPLANPCEAGASLPCPPTRELGEMPSNWRRTRRTRRAPERRPAPKGMRVPLWAPLPTREGTPIPDWMLNTRKAREARAAREAKR